MLPVPKLIVRAGRLRSREPQEPPSQQPVIRPAAASSASSLLTALASGPSKKGGTATSPGCLPRPAAWARGQRRTDKKERRKKARVLRALKEGYGDGRELNCFQVRQRYLKQRSVSKKTREEYKAHYERFLAWAAEARTALRDAGDMDRALERYLDTLFFDGQEAFSARYTVWGVGFMRDWDVGRLFFPRAHRALKGWRTAAPEATKEPAAWEAVVVGADALASDSGLSALSTPLWSLRSSLWAQLEPLWCSSTPTLRRMRC